jgi:hypothetical protein
MACLLVSYKRSCAPTLLLVPCLHPRPNAVVDRLYCSTKMNISERGVLRNNPMTSIQMKASDDTHLNVLTSRADF